MFDIQFLANSISNPLKTVGTNKASNRFVNDRTDMLTIPLTQICKFSIKPSHFLKDCKLAKFKPLYKKVTKADTKFL